ncbi:MAG: trypsin-like peptidase domain-containing protein [Pseudomonadota bacterium]
MTDIEPISKPMTAREERESTGAVAQLTGHFGSAANAPSHAGRAYLCGRAFPAMRSAAPLRRGGVRESIIEEDDRERILETELAPWRMIASLRLFGGGRVLTGTGWFAGPRTLITAGHCVHDLSAFGGWAESVQVAPGRNGDEFPFGKVRTRRLASLRGWVERADPDYDIGCLQLAEPLGERTGWLPIASPGAEELNDREVGISGYPADRGMGRFQYFDANRVIRVGERRLHYAVDTAGGQSGAPVWIPSGEDHLPQVVAVHAYGFADARLGPAMLGNAAPRIAGPILDVIRGWIAESERS